MEYSKLEEYLRDLKHILNEDLIFCKKVEDTLGISENLRDAFDAHIDLIMAILEDTFNDTDGLIDEFLFDSEFGTTNYTAQVGDKLYTIRGVESFITFFSAYYEGD